MSRDLPRPFRSLRPPGAPPELQRRVVEAARRASSEAREGADEPAPSLADRLWNSRPLRLAWALVVLALVGLNFHLEPSADRPGFDRGPGEPTELADRRPAGLEGAAEPRTLLAFRQPVIEALFGTGRSGAGGDPSRSAPGRTS